MRVEELSAQGCLNFIGGFWRQVYRDLHCSDEPARASALRFLDDRPNFTFWCRIGGVNFEPEAWREILESGVLPRGASAAFGK